MDLGNFSISLPVKDLARSQAFYEKLGFQVAAGAMEQKWLILVNGTTVVGLFQDMFPDIMLTFNPGWTDDGQNKDPFTDVRGLKAQLEEIGIPVEDGENMDQPEGPASIIIRDPDGNPILIDQHR